MSLPHPQNLVAEFVLSNKLEISAKNRLLDLTSEVGELAKELLKSTNYRSQEFNPSEAWVDEFGDVYFSLICLANSTDVNMESALKAALAKYQTRLTKSGSLGSGQ